jgi:hypothetical protein
MTEKKIEAADQRNTCPAAGNAGQSNFRMPTTSAPRPNQMMVKEGIINSRPIRQNPTIIQYHHSICMKYLVWGNGDKYIRKQTKRKKTSKVLLASIRGYCIIYLL